MAHPAKPDDHGKLRSMIDKLTDESWSGYFGNDEPYVEGEEMDVDDMIDRVERRAADRLQEYEERQEFTPPSKERREARQKAQYRIENGRTRTW